MDPAALTTTWLSPAAALTMPIASAWDRVGAFWISMIRSTSVRQPAAACSTSAR